MNRIHLRSPGDAPPAGPSTEIDFGTISHSSNPSSPHSLFAPLHYESNYAYPLLVWLHGRGGSMAQLRRVMPMISMRNYVAVAPQGLYPVDGNASAFDWGEPGTSLEPASQRVFDCVEAAARKFHIARHRIFLAGFASGGTLALRMAYQHPERFAGVVSIGGPFPGEGTPLASIRRSRKLPLMIAQGRDSETYPVDRTCQELRLFHAAGLSVTLRQYPCGDELTTKMLHDVDVWIMEIVTGVGPEGGEASATSFDTN